MTTQAVDSAHPILGFTHDWIANIARRVHHLYVVTPRIGRVNLPSNVTLHYLKDANQPIKTLPNHLFHHRHFARFILKGQVSAVFIHMIPKWAILAAPYCKVARTPLVLWYAHGHVPKSLKVSEKLVTRIITSTPEGCRLDSPKVRHIGQGIDTTHFHPVDRGENDRFHILTVGRLSPVKRLDLTIETIQMLVHEFGCHRALLQLIGGPARPEDERYVRQLQTQIKQSGVEDHVQFLGIRTYDSIVGEYQQGDVLLNLSQTNSLDKVALEAMACGVPVLSSNPAFKSMLTAVQPALFLSQPDPKHIALALKNLMNQTNAERLAVGLQLRRQIEETHQLSQLADRIIAALEPET